MLSFKRLYQNPIFSTENKIEMENSTIFSFDTLHKQTLVMNVQVLNIDQGFFSDLFQGLQKSYV